LIFPAAGIIVAGMSRSILINARWDDEAGVWLATSLDAPGLVVEAETWTLMIAEVRLVLRELLALKDRERDELSLTFRAEERVDLAPAMHFGTVIRGANV
jgi:hypothetical protein